MTVNPMCPSRETMKMERPVASAVESPVGARRRGHQEHRSTPVQ
jgi:hypothetical protein